jgi:hypothetical protein
MGREAMPVPELRERLVELQQEFDRGQRQLELLERQRGELRDALLRIGGAMQVLEELLPSAEHPPPESAGRR